MEPEEPSSEYLKLLALINEDSNALNCVSQLLAKERHERDGDVPKFPKRPNNSVHATAPEASRNGSFDFLNQDFNDEHGTNYDQEALYESTSDDRVPLTPIVDKEVRFEAQDDKDDHGDDDSIPPPPIRQKSKAAARSFKIEEFVSPYNEYYNDQKEEKGFVPRMLSRGVSMSQFQASRGLSMANLHASSMANMQSAKSEFSKKLRKLVTQSNSFRNQTAERTHKLITHVQTVLEHKATTARIENAMLKRRADGIVAIQDALLCIRGTLMEELPNINRQWYVAVYPQFVPMPELKLFKPSTTSVKVEPKIVDIVKEQERLDEIEEDFQLKTRPSSKYSKIPEVLTGPQFNMDSKENVQSAMLKPFNTESFQAMSYYIHLSDIMRYVSLGIVVYIETNNVALTNELNTNTKVNKSGITSNAATQSELDERRKFVPAFYGTVPINQGAVFGPYGGRMHFTLTPNNTVINILPSPIQLLATEGLNLSFTFIPVALPSTALMLSFRSFIHAAPCYPCNLVDAECLSPVIVQWESFYGAVLCVGAYKERILVSSRGGKETAIIQLLEYDKNGKFVGKVARVANPAAGEKVLMIFTGRDHMACCTNTGYFIILQEHVINPKSTKYAQYKPTSRDETPADAINNAAYWRQSIVFEAHPKSTVVCGCVLHYSNIDIFFTCDKGNNIAVHFIENGELIKNYMNHTFFDPEYSRILCMSVTGNRLYLADNCGEVSTVSLSAILNDGFIEYAGMLSRYIIRVDHIFTKEGSDTFKPSACNAMAIYSMNGFLGLKDEDSMRMEEEANLKRLLSTRVDPVRYDVLEGHVLVIGGDDNEPVVRVLQPHPFGMREIVTLTGHKRAVTNICVDAAGRYLFTGSVGDNTILIWDGLTFTCEKQIENVSIGCMCLSHNALLVSSFKTPFLRMWKTKYTVAQSKQTKRAEVAPSRYSRTLKGALAFAMDTMLTSIDRTIAWIPNQTKLDPVSYDAGEEEAYDDLFGDGHPDQIRQRAEEQVVAVRSSRWCFSVLKGTQYVAVKSIIAPRYLEEEAKVIINRWKVQYERMDGSYDNSTLLIPLSKIEVSSPIHYSHRQNLSAHSLKSILHNNSEAAHSFKKSLSFKRTSNKNLKEVRKSAAGVAAGKEKLRIKNDAEDDNNEDKDSNDDEEEEEEEEESNDDDDSDYSLSRDNTAKNNKNLGKPGLSVSFRKDSTASSVDESVRNILSNDDIFITPSAKNLKPLKPDPAVKASPKGKKSSFAEEKPQKKSKKIDVPKREKRVLDLTNSYHNRNVEMEFHAPPVQGINLTDTNRSKVDPKKARIKVLTDYDSEGESEDTETRRRRRMNTPKKVKLRCHFSSSDESESEFVRYYGNGKNKARQLTVVEVVNKKLEAELAKMEKIKQRQKKLRPKLVFHLNDNDTSEDDSDN